MRGTWTMSDMCYHYVRVSDWEVWWGERGPCQTCVIIMLGCQTGRSDEGNVDHVRHPFQVLPPQFSCCTEDLCHLSLDWFHTLAFCFSFVCLWFLSLHLYNQLYSVFPQGSCHGFAVCAHPVMMLLHSFVDVVSKDGQTVCLLCNCQISARQWIKYEIRGVDPYV